MDIFKVRVTDKAIADIEAIYLYIINTFLEKSYAIKQISHIREEIQRLDIFPLKNKQVDWEPWRSKGVRQMPVNNFMVYYIVDNKEKAVSILRVFYSKRDVGKLVK